MSYMVNAKHLATLLKTWREKRELPENDVSRAWRQGYNRAIEGVVRLLTDDEARSTISVSGWTRATTRAPSTPIRRTSTRRLETFAASLEESKEPQP